MILGKTAPTYRKKLEEKINELKPYKRALRKREKEIFDEIMESAKRKAHASTNQAFVDPMDGIYLSILLEMKRELKEIKREINNQE